MTIDDQIRNQKLQYDPNREAAKIGKTLLKFTNMSILLARIYYHLTSNK